MQFVIVGEGVALLLWEEVLFEKLSKLTFPKKKGNVFVSRSHKISALRVILTRHLL